MKLDPETKLTSADSVNLMSKCTELFCESFVKEVNRNAASIPASSKSSSSSTTATTTTQRAIKYAHLADVVSKVERYQFLSELIPVLEESEMQGRETETSGLGSSSSTSAAGNTTSKKKKKANVGGGGKEKEPPEKRTKKSAVSSSTL